MQNIFERNLQTIAEDVPQGQFEEVKYQEEANESGKYKIDLLDGADDEDAEGNLNMNNDE